MKKIICAIVLALTMSVTCIFLSACDCNGTFDGGCKQNSAETSVCLIRPETPAPEQGEHPEDESGDESGKDYERSDPKGGNKRHRPGKDSERPARERDGHRPPRPQPREGKPEDGEIYFVIFGKLPFPLPGFGIAPPADDTPDRTPIPAPEVLPDGELG